MGIGDGGAFLGWKITRVACSPWINTSFAATAGGSYTSSRLCG